MLRNSIRNSIRSFKSADGGLPPFSFGNALQFDGVNDFVSFPTYTLNGEVTFNFWVNFNLFKNFNTFFGHVGAGSNFSYILSRSNTNISLFSGVDRSFAVPQMSLGVWYMITITRNSGNVWNVYQNGIKSVDEYTDSNNYPFSVIGAYQGTILFLNVAIDETAIWNKAITQSEISDLYNSGNGDFATNYQNANLIAYWRCNEEDGATTLTDEQGAYNGTLNNFSTPPAYFIPH